MERPTMSIMRDMVVKGGWWWFRKHLGALCVSITGWIEEPMMRWMESLLPVAIMIGSGGADKLLKVV